MNETTTEQGIEPETLIELEEIEPQALRFSLADAIREGAKGTKRATGSFGSEDKACALRAAFLAAKARGLV